MINRFKNNKTVAFTLAETLITLSIIGIVAAITIPTLVGNYHKQQYVTQLKKFYAEMSQAVKLLKNDREVDSVSETGLLTFDSSDPNASYARVGEFLKQYFKVVKDCGRIPDNSPNPCFAPKYTTINSDGWGSLPIPGYSVITANGTSIAIKYGGSSLAGIPQVCVDINGLKGPNVGGRDIFNFSIYRDASMDDFNPECSNCGGETREKARNIKFNDQCRYQSYGVGCFGKILNDGWKMDY